jgi:hypothetical protein
MVPRITAKRRFEVKSFSMSPYPDHSGAMRRNNLNQRAKGVYVRMWQSRPVLFTFVVGAIIGFVTAAALMLTIGHVSVVTNKFLWVLWPSAFLGAWGFDNDRAFALVVIIIELVSNALLYALVFGVPAGIVVAVRRSFGKPEEPPSIGHF